METSTNKHEAEPVEQNLPGALPELPVEGANGDGARPKGPGATHIQDLIDLIKEGDFYKMQTFDQHLFQLVRDDVITYDEALSASTSPHDLTVELRQAGLVS